MVAASPARSLLLNYSCASLLSDYPLVRYLTTVQCPRGTPTCNDSPRRLGRLHYAMRQAWCTSGWFSKEVHGGVNMAKVDIDRTYPGCGREVTRYCVWPRLGSDSHS